MLYLMRVVDYHALGQEEAGAVAGVKNLAVAVA